MAAMSTSISQKKTSTTHNKKKKIRVSKHVLKSRQERTTGNGDKDTKTNEYVIADGGRDGSITGPQDSTTTVVQQETIIEATNKGSKQTKKRSLKNLHVKDPEDAATYLNSWKATKMEDNSSSNKKKTDELGGWKFNKNTQSWLIRHMYECDKISKSTFSLLLEYLEGLEGNITKERIRTEATRRALRYKEHCNSTTTQQERSGTTADEKVVDNNQIPIDGEEESRWMKLSENDKRKEYKRARKILDLVQA